MLSVSGSLSGKDRRTTHTHTRKRSFSGSRGIVYKDCFRMCSVKWNTNRYQKKAAVNEHRRCSSCTLTLNLL